MYIYAEWFFEWLVSRELYNRQFILRGRRCFSQLTVVITIKQKQHKICMCIFLTSYTNTH